MKCTVDNRDLQSLGASVKESDVVLFFIYIPGIL